MKLRKEALAVFGIAAALIASLLIVVDSRQHTASAANYEMRVDAVSGGGVDTALAVSGSGTFNVGIQITASAQVYGGYQWEIQFPTAGLSFDDGHVDTGTGFTGCQGPTDNTFNSGAPGGQTVFGAGAGCVNLGAPPAQPFLGTVVTFNMHCLANGAHSLLLLNTAQDLSGFGSDILNTVGTGLGAVTFNATITCSGLGALPTDTPTNTPTITPTPPNTATPTHTPTPCVGASCPTSTPTPTPTSTLAPVYTRTPTRTPTGVATAAGAGGAPTQSSGSIPPPTGGGAPAANGGGTRSGIRLPDTGSGASGSAGGDTWWMLIGVIGGGIAVAGGSAIILRKRSS